MLLFLIRQILLLRKALLGRSRPRAMAAGLACGVVIGLVPKLNLTAIGFMILVACINLNHAIAVLSAFAVTFIASRLDPYSNTIGTMVLESPKMRPILEPFFQLPLVPWTRLNNTVVLGSFLIGSAAAVPTYLVSLPMFRFWASRKRPETPPPEATAQATSPPSTAKAARERIQLAKTEPTPATVTALPIHASIASHRPVPAAAATAGGGATANGGAASSATASSPTASSPTASSGASIDKATSNAAASSDATGNDADRESLLGGGQQLVETHIDIVRLRKTGPLAAPPEDAPPPASSNEALRFLVRHVQSQRKGKAA
jgi:uncharacterized protein (TIGR03546 family)